MFKVSQKHITEFFGDWKTLKTYQNLELCVCFSYPFPKKIGILRTFLFKNRGRQEICTFFLSNNTAWGITSVRFFKIREGPKNPLTDSENIKVSQGRHSLLLHSHIWLSAATLICFENDSDFWLISFMLLIENSCILST